MPLAEASIGEWGLRPALGRLVEKRRKKGARRECLLSKLNVVHCFLLSRYAYFRAYTHGQQLVGDVLNTALRNFGVEAMMRVRSSEGLTPTGFYGAFTMENTRVSFVFHEIFQLFGLDGRMVALGNISKYCHSPLLSTIFFSCAVGR